MKDKSTCFEQVFEPELRTNLMREFRNRNEIAINFLSQKSILIELLSILKQGKRSQHDLFSVVELLSAEIPSILGHHFLCLVLPSYLS